MTLDDAIGYIADPVLAKLFKVECDSIEEKRVARGRPGLRSDNWRHAVEAFGYDRVLTFLTENGAAEAVVHSLRKFNESRAAISVGLKRDKPLGRIRKRVSGKLTAKERQRSSELADWTAPSLPKTRGDCIGGCRPCPLVRCKYHLALDYYEDVTMSNGEEVRRAGIIVVPALLEDPVTVLNSMRWTCLLDAIDANDEQGYPLEDVGLSLDITRERIRQVEEMSLVKLKGLKETTRLAEGLNDHLDSPSEPVVRVSSRKIQIRRSP